MKPTQFGMLGYNSQRNSIESIRAAQDIRPVILLIEMVMWS